MFYIPLENYFQLYGDVAKFWAAFIRASASKHSGIEHRKWFHTFSFCSIGESLQEFYCSTDLDPSTELASVEGLQVHSYYPIMFRDHVHWLAYGKIIIMTNQKKLSWPWLLPIIRETRDCIGRMKAFTEAGESTSLFNFELAIAILLLCY